MTVAIVTVSAVELEALVRKAVAEAIVQASRQSASTVERVSARAAAVMMHKRSADVTNACASGALKARRSGSGRRWAIAVADLDAWACAGFPSRIGGCQ